MSVGVPAVAEPATRDPALVRALRLLWVSTFVGRFGDQLAIVTLIWLVLESTRSAGGQALFQFAYTSFASIGSLLVGAILDRYRVVPAMVADGIARALVLLAVAGAVVLSFGVLPAALLAGLWIGLTSQFAGNGFPAIVAAVLTPAERPNGNMIEALAGALGGILGPVVAGGLIATVGVAPAMLAAAICSVLSSVPLVAAQRPLLQRLPPRSIGVVGRSGIMAGVRAVRRNPVLLSTAVGWGLLNVVGVSLAVAMPLFATEVLHGGVGAYSLLVSANAMGAIPGILVGRAVGDRLGTGRALVVGLALAGLLYIPIAFAREVGMAVALMALSGFMGGSVNAWAQTLRMANMTPEIRGRAFGAIRAISNGPAPLAALAAGVIVPLVGLDRAFMVAGLGLILIAAGLGTVRSIREG